MRNTGRRAASVWATRLQTAGVLPAGLIVNLGPPQSAIIHVAAIDAGTGKVAAVLEKDLTWLGRPSPDGRWLSFMHFSAEGNATVFIAPFTPGTVSPESSWIRVTDRQSIDEESAWSADGRMLYYVSARDGFRCIYGAGFDPSTKRVTRRGGRAHVSGPAKSSP